MLTEGAFQGENYANSALVVVVTVFTLAFLPALGLLGVTIAGVVSENKRRKWEQMPWQPQPPYDYAQQYTEIPQEYPGDREPPRR
jgi:hypothetical protein